jgi:hypothetical protein
MVTKFYFSNGPISAVHSLYIVIIVAVVGIFAMGLEGWISVFVLFAHRLHMHSLCRQECKAHTYFACVSQCNYVIGISDVVPHSRIKRCS